ncbi:uncharacterized protein [Hemitrygon akajei]|uniref:uncharacterized protein isoform X2 n=1 Tax=Hemitrygon akajei TaxID=2704970 RepID=UPI003BF9DA7C
MTAALFISAAPPGHRQLATPQGPSAESAPRPPYGRPAMSFKHSGLEMPEAAGSENEMISQPQQVRNYKEYEGIDNRSECYNKNEDLEDTIVKRII